MTGSSCVVDLRDTFPVCAVVEPAFAARAAVAQPDGDSIRFAPDDPDEWNLVVGGEHAVIRNSSGAAQLRLDGIDALETDYTRNTASAAGIGGCRECRIAGLARLRGAGEIGIVGSAAAVVNAVYHATDLRVRDLPVQCDAPVGRDR
jgi:hypothetical protein